MAKAKCVVCICLLCILTPWNVRSVPSPQRTLHDDSPELEQDDLKFLSEKLQELLANQNLPTVNVQDVNRGGADKSSAGNTMLWEGKTVKHTEARMEKKKSAPNKADPIPFLRLTIDELFAALDLTQAKFDRPFIAPGLWEEKKGVYPSYVRLNFVGKPEVSELRELIAVFDNNMFATAWITVCLLEAHYYGNAPTPTSSQLNMAIDAIYDHRDRNRNYSNSVMAFWPQAYEANVTRWVSTPFNLLHAFDVFTSLPWDQIDKILEKLGWKDVEAFLKRIIESQSGYMRAFHIPPDFDDTFVNLGLGSLLMDLAQDLPDSLALWQQHNSNLTSVLDALKQYAYRPLSKDKNVNTIDPRTYYYLRHFLNDAVAKGEDVALVPTWVQNIAEAHEDYFRDVIMPFQVNNVDVTVAANAVYGITSSLLNGLLPLSTLDDPDFKQIYHNTTSLIAYMVEKALFDRPDLALLYYPSVFEFYWFVARTYHRMETAIQGGQTLPEAMKDLYPRLRSVLEGPMTKHVISKAKAEGDDMLYYDDFLGNADLDRNNNTVKKAEDRIYTTTMAANALLTTWTLFNSTSRTGHWKQNTPADVKSTVEKTVRWLAHYVLRVTYKPWNAFFSGSYKGRTTSPDSYPGNRVELFNGTDIPVPKKRPHDMFLYGVEGHIPEKEYRIMINETHFGRPTPTKFVTYNDPYLFFPFWSSPAYTYATTMLVLSRYSNLDDAVNLQ